MGTLTEEGAVGSETGPVRGSCATEAAVGRACGRSGDASGSVHVRGAVASAISAVRIGSESPVTRPEGKRKSREPANGRQISPRALTHRNAKQRPSCLSAKSKGILGSAKLCV